MKFSHVLQLFLSLFILAMLAACGGGGGIDGQPNIEVSISPLQVTLDAGQTQQFTATVTGTTNKGVNWSVRGSSCTGSACGTVDANGLYTAPMVMPADMTINVMAVAQANSTAGRSSTVNLKAVAISVNPSSISMEAGEQYTVTASVTHHTNTDVTWSVTGTGCSGSACGTFDASTGVFEAPTLIAGPATVAVKATSVADTTKSATCTVTLVPLSIKISPTTGNLDGGQSLQFTSTVEHHANKSVTWAVNGLGSITTAGLYSVPLVMGSQSTATVTVTSVADPSKSASATVTLWPVSIAISPTTATLGGGESNQFTATISHHANKAVTWSLTGLGNLDTNGLYQAPAVIAAQSSATVKVTSVVDPTKSASAVVTLIPISVTVSPATASVALGGTKQFTATVTGTSNKLVNWSVSGTGCSGSDCGTINSTGLYAAPANAPNPPTATVKATSAQDPTKSGTATVSLTQDLNSRLQGQYVVYGQGFDASGKMFATVSSFVADGHGNITNGVQDLNSVAGPPVQKQTYTGTYEVWADGRGTWTITGGASARFILNADGTEFNFMEFDATGAHGSGIGKKQTKTDFLLSKITGDYAFALTGTGVYGDRNGVVGRLHSNGAGALSDGMLDTKVAGEPVVPDVAFTGTMAMDPTYGASAGRGTMTVTGGVGTMHASLYIVNANEAFILVTDTIGANMPLLSGRIVKQTGAPFTDASWNGACAYYMTGTAGNPKAPAVLVGYIEPNGTGSLYVEYARNHAGFITEFGSGIATYEVDPNGMGAFTSSTYGDFVFVLSGANRGFLMGTGGLDEVHVGWFEPQVVPSGGFKIASLSGDYPFGTSEMAAVNAVTLTGVTTWNGAGGLGGTLDASSTTGNFGDQMMAGAYTVTGSGARPGNGRGILQLTQPAGSKYIFYPVSDSKLFMVNVDPNNPKASALVVEK
jgi:hypothetical protein